MIDSWLATYTEIEAGTAAARATIEAHLARLPGGEERDYWQAIADRYALTAEATATATNLPTSRSESRKGAPAA